MGHVMGVRDRDSWNRRVGIVTDPSSQSADDTQLSELRHGEWDDRGVQRWCSGCEDWVLTVDWMAHFDHDPE